MSFLKISRTKKTAKKTKKTHEAKHFALQFYICCANFRKIDPETKKSKKKRDGPLKTQMQRIIERLLTLVTWKASIKQLRLY